MFSQPIKIDDEKYPIRSIEIGDKSIRVSEEGIHEWIYREYRTMNYNSWYLYSENHHRKKMKNYENRAASIKGTKATAKWTFIWYLNEDNNLDGAGYSGDVQEAINGFNHAAEGLVNIILLDDRSSNGDTKLYYVDDSGATDISSQAGNWYSSEMDMGNPQSLIDFVEWTVQNYPAEHYFVDLWDHGGDYDGAMWDDTSNTHMTLADLRTAALTIYQDLGFPIDIWGYDACLMDAGADDYQIKQGVDIIAASEHTEGGDGWDYKALIGNLTDNPDLTPEQYAYNFVVHVDDENSRSVIVTMATINTTSWDYWFMQAYNELAQAIRQKAGTENSNIKNAFSNAAEADSDYWSTGIDVGDFAKQLLNYVSDSKIKYWANRLLENVSTSVINSYDTDTNGRKIVMAETNSTSEVDSSFYIFKETEWDEMLDQVYNQGTDDNNQEPSCEITSPADGTAVIQTSTITIQGTASDPDGSVSRVEVKIDKGDWLQASGTTSWSYTLDASQLTLGKHYIFARSFDGDLYSLYSYITINVVSRTDLPDLTLSSNDISFSNPNPNEGETITITATVHNVGNNDSYNVNVSFYVDSVDDAHLIGTVDYGDIPQGGSATNSINWDTTGYAGNHNIIVYADSTHTIAELNENNNSASKSITVNGYAVDLSCDNNESAVQPGGSASYTITVTNLGTLQDTIDLSVDNPTSWSTTLSTNQVTLNAGNSTTVTLTVNAPSNANPGDKAVIGVIGVSEGNSTKKDEVYTTTTVKPQILLVDDDAGQNYETYFENALNADGYQYDVWDVNSQGSPGLSDLENYKVVIWTTGDDYSSTLSDTDQNNLMTYLDQGGRLYLSSQDFLWQVSGGNDGSISNTFVNNYLHVTAVTNDVSYSSVQGVSGDPITDGFGTINLNYPYDNYDDEITIDSSAYTIFTNPSSGNTVADRVDSGTWRLVFTAFSFEAVENQDANTGAQLMDKIIIWLLEGGGGNPPNTPSTPSGPTSGKVGVSYTYTTSTTDPDGDQVKYTFDWGDGTYTTTGYYNSGDTASASHSWSKTGTYEVKVKAIDSNGLSSAYSSSLTVTITADMIIDVETPQNGSTVSGVINISGKASDPNTASFNEIWNLNYGAAIYEGPQAIGDVTGDGKNELLIGGRDGKLHVYDWNGNTFVEIASITDPSGNGDNPGGYAIGDIDGDGKNEIAIAWDHDFSAFKWNGNSFVQIGNTWTGDGTDNAYDCAIGDYDNDGHNEVVIADDPSNGDPEITVLSWDGSQWVEETSWNDPDGDLTTPVVRVADVDGDGLNEIIATPGAKAVVLNWDGSKLNPTYLATNYPAGAYGIGIADLDGDGINDIVIGLDAPTIYVYKWTGSGYQEIFNTTWSGEDSIIEGLDAGDVDNDGINEIVAGTNYIHILQWNGTTFVEEHTLNYTDMGELAVTYVGDVTNDGKNEIVAGNVIADPNSEYHVRVINYTDSIQKVEVSIDDAGFSHPLAVNGTYNWYIDYDTSTLNDGTHRIYVRTYNGDFYTVRWIEVTTNNGNVSEFSAFLPIVLVLGALVITVRKIRKS